MKVKSSLTFPKSVPIPYCQPSTPMANTNNYRPSFPVIYLSVHLSIYLSIHPSIYVDMQTHIVYIYMCTDTYIHVYTCMHGTNMIYSICIFYIYIYIVNVCVCFYTHTSVIINQYIIFGNNGFIIIYINVLFFSLYIILHLFLLNIMFLI